MEVCNLVLLQYIPHVHHLYILFHKSLVLKMLHSFQIHLDGTQINSVEKLGLELELG